MNSLAWELWAWLSLLAGSLTCLTVGLAGSYWGIAAFLPFLVIRPAGFANSVQGTN